MIPTDITLSIAQMPIKKSSAFLINKEGLQNDCVRIDKI